MTTAHRISTLCASTAALTGLIWITATAISANAQSGNIASDPVIEKMQIRIDAMESEIARLTGRVDSMGFEIGQARRKAGDAVDQITGMEVLIAELTARLERIEAAANAPRLAAEDTARRIRSGQTATNQTESQTSSGGLVHDQSQRPELESADPFSITPPHDLNSRSDRPGLPVNPDLADTPDELFVQARQFLLQGEYPAAEKAFDSFVSRYPDHKNVGEVYYWLAESLFIQDAWPEAAKAYVTLLSDYPTTQKAPEALVRLARTLRKMGDLDQACAVLRELPDRYPSAPPVIVSIAATERARSRCTS